MKSAGEPHAKQKVIFFVVDSLMSQAIDRGIRQKQLPTFRYLIDHGQYYKDMVSSFPTMSVTIDSSLLTGAYPDKHRIPGLTWYSASENKVITYGTGPLDVLQRGIDPVLVHALIDLNGKHLNRRLPTIYEDLHDRGLTSGSVNGMIYRGAMEHRLSIPRMMEALTSLPEEIAVKGPDFFTLGSLSNPLAGIKKLPDGLTKQMGMNNEYAIETVKTLITQNKMPDFLYVYLPDLDGKLHKNGPSELRGIVETDRQLNSLLQVFSSRKQALTDYIIILAGDSGMNQVLPAGRAAVIHLPTSLNKYHVLSPGQAVSDNTDIVLGVNDTMAYVHSLKAEHSLRSLANELAKDSRIATISWREGDWIYSLQGGTANEFKYKHGGKLIDRYGQKWTVSKNEKVLDLKLDAAQNKLAYGKYPDVLRRLYGALYSLTGKFLVVTAKTGYEFAERNTPVHLNGGSHGDLGEFASYVPLIISGTKQRPDFLRIVDLKPYLLKLLTGDNG